ncbi:DUF3397 domain-containing protein [Cohnella endophytica]|uniref:DUF3397 domain-containing protein n=1 Tax=Cohnella endophytica TaxID=2419778 RepID=A0A494XXE7_9BACL|nr:DUF3397 domain-containing protein [Cohnella endophytica]RKP55257.1 DUF3397 domain-containing protein [Cohnella endophytica]
MLSSIWKALVSAYAFLATVPVIPFLLVYFVASTRGGDRKSAFRLAMDLTNAFLIGCVAELLNRRLHTSFGLFFLILLLLIGGGLIGNAQNRIRGKVDAGKLFRAVWRLSFFLMVPLYVLLMFFELVFPAVKA